MSEAPAEARLHPVEHSVGFGALLRRQDLVDIRCAGEREVERIKTVRNVGYVYADPAEQDSPPADAGSG